MRKYVLAAFMQNSVEDTAMNLLAPWRRRSEALTKDNGDIFTSFQNEMNQLFNKFNGDFELAPAFAAGEKWLPAMDVQDTEKELVIKAELPGVQEKDIDVSVENSVLTVKGEKRSEKEEKGKDFYRKECSCGSFLRSVQLPCEVDRDKVEATLKNGVLNIRLPKTVEAQKQARKIAVKAG